jgi:hypothetical protein
MNTGIVTAYDNDLQSGEITDTVGETFLFYYKDGQNMIYGDGLATPQFSGHHNQPDGSALKLPDVGDAVCFTKPDKDSIKVWGYARHFIDLAEKRHSTRFVT